MMDLGLTGKSLQSVLVEYTLRLQFSDVYFIVIESPFNLDSYDRSVSLSPEEDSDEAFQPIRELVGQTVDEATADEAGALRVRFSGGALLQVPADEAYEAWSVSGPNGALVVCTPGGKLAIWSENSES
jgi:hypothetical protein